MVTGQIKKTHTHTMTSNQLQPIPDRLKDKVTLVTGGAGNIGFETAKRFLLEGAKVALVDIHEKSLAEAKQKLLDAVVVSEDNKNTVAAAVADRILAVQADVTVEEEVARFIQDTVTHFGGLDVAFFCAGMSYSSTSILDTEVDLWDKVIRVNTRSGTFYNQDL